VKNSKKKLKFTLKKSFQAFLDFIFYFFCGKIHSLVPGFLSQFFVIEHLANFPSAKLVGFILGKN